VANTYTGTATITNQVGITNLVTTAYDKYVEFALRSQPLFRQAATKRPVDVSHAGASVRFQKYVDLAVATTPLTENVDPDATNLVNTTYVDVTLNEYGNSVITTDKLVFESLSDVDPAIANIIAYNQVDTLDQLVRAVLIAGDNRISSDVGAVSTQAVGSLTTADDFSSKLVRYTVAKLRGANALPLANGLYGCYIHPDVSHDLRAETGGAGTTAAWRSPHEYSGASDIWGGVLGIYEGAFFIESPRTYIGTDGASSKKVHRTLIMGQQALAEAVGYEPQVVVGPVTDKLMRFRPVGWKALIGWNRFREESLYRIETTSSITA
jgi:N4-gp56 family major capsid protein